jgi:hypothetical protein
MVSGAIPRPTTAVFEKSVDIFFNKLTKDMIDRQASQLRKIAKLCGPEGFRYPDLLSVATLIRAAFERIEGGASDLAQPLAGILEVAGKPFVEVVRSDHARYRTSQDAVIAAIVLCVGCSDGEVALISTHTLRRILSYCTTVEGLPSLDSTLPMVEQCDLAGQLSRNLAYRTETFPLLGTSCALLIEEWVIMKADASALFCQAVTAQPSHASRAGVGTLMTEVPENEYAEDMSSSYRATFGCGISALSLALSYAVQAGDRDLMFALCGALSVIAERGDPALLGEVLSHDVQSSSEVPFPTFTYLADAWRHTANGGTWRIHQLSETTGVRSDETRDVQTQIVATAAALLTAAAAWEEQLGSNMPGTLNSSQDSQGALRDSENVCDLGSAYDCFVQSTWMSILIGHLNGLDAISTADRIHQEREHRRWLCVLAAAALRSASLAALEVDFTCADLIALVVPPLFFEASQRRERLTGQSFGSCLIALFDCASSQLLAHRVHYSLCTHLAETLADGELWHLRRVADAEWWDVRFMVEALGALSIPRGTLQEQVGLGGVEAVTDAGALPLCGRLLSQLAIVSRAGGAGAIAGATASAAIRLLSRMGSALKGWGWSSAEDVGEGLEGLSSLINAGGKGWSAGRVARASAARLLGDLVVWENPPSATLKEHWSRLGIECLCTVIEMSLVENVVDRNAVGYPPLLLRMAALRSLADAWERSPWSGRATWGWRSLTSGKGAARLLLARWAQLLPGELGLDIQKLHLYDDPEAVVNGAMQDENPESTIFRDRFQDMLQDEDSETGAERRACEAALRALAPRVFHLLEGEDPLESTADEAGSHANLSQRHRSISTSSYNSSVMVPVATEGNVVIASKCFPDGPEFEPNDTRILRGLMAARTTRQSKAWLLLESELASGGVRPTSPDAEKLMVSQSVLTQQLAETRTVTRLMSAEALDAQNLMADEGFMTSMRVADTADPIKRNYRSFVERTSNVEGHRMRKQLAQRAKTGTSGERIRRYAANENENSHSSLRPSTSDPCDITRDVSVESFLGLSQRINSSHSQRQ